MSALDLTVTGGADGITARLDDLLAMSTLLHSGASSIEYAIEELNSPALRWSLSIADGHALLGPLLREELLALAGPYGPLALAAAHLDEVGRLLLAAADGYWDADHAVLDSILGGLGHLFMSAVFVEFGRYPAASSQLFQGLPGLTDLVASIAAPVEDASADLVPDGHAVLHDLGVDERLGSLIAPATVTALVGDLALRNQGRHGEISVSFVVGTDGARRAIVDIPGTKSWNPAPNHDVTSVGTDLRALAGRDTAYEEGIFAALRAAGVAPEEDVLLVGHSEGGIVAVNAARDAARSGQFRITHVVTAGAPIGKVSRELPDSVQVLALENSADVVPHCDAADNPDRPNITTVTVDDQHFNPGRNHDLTDTYLPAAAAADASDDASIRAFTASARGFLDSTTMQTHTYWITRGF